MWLRRIGLVIILLFLVVTTMFSMVNHDQVQVIIPGGVGTVRLPLFQIVIVTLVAGFMAGAIACWVSSFKYRQQAQRILKQNRMLEEELTNLRNLPLDVDLHL